MSSMLSGSENGRSTTLPGIFNSPSAVKAARNAPRWPSASPGTPIVSPNGNSIAAIRGTLADAVRSGMFEKEMVVKPAASISR